MLNIFISVVTLVLFAFIAYCVFSLYACVQLIKSVKNVRNSCEIIDDIRKNVLINFLPLQRSSRQARPFLVLAAFETLVAFLPILHFNWMSILQAIVGTTINGYIFICVNSMWEMFRDEAMRGHNRQYQQGTMFNKV